MTATVDYAAAADALGLPSEPVESVEPGAWDFLSEYRQAVAERYAAGLLTDDAALLASRAADRADMLGLVTVAWRELFSLLDLTNARGYGARRLLVALGLLVRGTDGEWLLAEPVDWRDTASMLTGEVAA